MIFLPSNRAGLKFARHDWITLTGSRECNPRDLAGKAGDVKKGDYITIAVVAVFVIIVYAAFIRPVYAANAGTVTN